jgi:uncharacterized protein YjiS (DUF1127 family)
MPPLFFRASRAICSHRRIFDTFAGIIVSFPHRIAMLDSAGPRPVLPEPGPQIMFLAAAVRFARTYLKYRSTVSALAQLDDRCLRDIGLTRYDISRTAWRMARG